TTKPAAAASAPESAALPKMTIPYNQISVSQTPLFVAVEKGLFKQYGVDVTTEYMANSPQLVAAMLGGQINMSSAGQDAVVGAGLISGAIEAAVLVPPVTTQAKKQGLKELANLADYNLAFYQGPVDAKKSWLQANRPQALNAMKGYVAGIAATYRDKPATLEAI